MRIMKKIAFIIFLGGILTAGLFAQRSFLGLSFGASLPSEEFAKKSVAEDGGYALPGFVIEFQELMFLIIILASPALLPSVQIHLTGISFNKT